ncbi:glycosyltransferase family 39 protein [bacterium]|nr:glycosyltransferase family 39 protein [bacterium]
MLSEVTEKDQPNRRFSENIHPLLDRFGSFLEANRSYFVAGLCVIFFAASGLLSFRKVFWNDEMYTLYFSRLRIWPDLWWALSTGGDQLPPLSILLTKVSSWMFSENHISIRLPETAGFLVMSLCLYRIVSQRITPAYGLVAMVFPWITPAFSYSYEARPYALVLGFSTLSFLCWLSITEDRNRKRNLFVLFLSLLGAWMSHYYGMLVLFPLVVGELVRTRSMGRLDFPVWIAFFLSLTPLILFLPLLRGSLHYATNFWSKANWSDMFLSYQSLLDSAAVPLIFASILTVLFFRTGQNKPSSPTIRNFRPYELAALTAFVLLPVVAVTGAKITTGIFVDRYALSSIIGFSILVALSFWYFLKTTKVAIVVLLCFLTGFIIDTYFSFSRWTDDYNAMNQTTEFLKVNAGSDLPVVCSYSHIFFRIQHYGPQDLSSRVFYLADPVASLRYVNHDTIDRGLLDLKPWWPLQNVRSYDLFIRSYPRFFLLHFSSDEDWRWDWILSSLIADHRKIEMKGRDGNQFLFLISSQ